MPPAWQKFLEPLFPHPMFRSTPALDAPFRASVALLVFLFVFSILFLGGIEVGPLDFEITFVAQSREV